jgi:aminopeptidase N
MTLWKTFPENQAKYLEKAQHWIGGNDKSLRIMYLTFALLSADNQNNESLYAELVAYTAPTFESSVRQNAITNALSINPKDSAVLRNLVNATVHHKWQFSKFGRDKIRQLLKKEGYADLFQSILPSLSESEVIQLQKLLSEKA